MFLCPENNGMRQSIENIGRKAAACGKPCLFPESSREAVDWLVERGFATKTSENKLVLLSACMESRTTLSQPSLVQTLDSLFGLRKKLCSQGWSPANPASPADVASRRFRSQSIIKSYFELLLTRPLENHFSKTFNTG